MVPSMHIRLATSLTLLAATLATAAPVVPMKVLVTNDDGYNAPGIDALVEALDANPNLDVVVIAPLNNSSGTGESITTGSSITISNVTTLSGHPAKAVAGFPGDTTLFALKQELASSPPALIVSGVNAGQNLSAEIVPASGTVGAATWAARHGVPAIAVSADLVLPDYPAAAAFTATIVEQFRKSKGFQKKLKEREAPFRGVILNINYPGCSSGSVRGARVVATGRANTITGYTSTGVDSWQANVSSTNLFSSNCLSTLDPPTTDVEAYVNGFVAVSPLVADRSVTGNKLKDFKFIQKLF